ncbi:LPXTG-motif protein cell wall anchor domain protein [Eubacterium brachy ATCC 33089]|nr:LPXTG-motif protein cell wall anchor domain protein [Eubacterium brachy ATCC 33089]
MNTIHSKRKSIYCKKVLSFAIVFAMVLSMLGIKNTEYSHAQNTVQIKDVRTGIIYESDSGNITGNEILEVTDVNPAYINSLPSYKLTDDQLKNPSAEDMKKILANSRKQYSEYIYNTFSKAATDGKFKTLMVHIKRDGKYFIPEHQGKLLIPIPKSWDTSKFHAKIAGLQNEVDYPNSMMAIVNRDGQNYFEVKDPGKKDSEGTCFNKELHNNIGIGEVRRKVDVSKLTEGVYEVEPDFIKANTENTASMAGGTLQSKGYLVVKKDGSKEVYLNFKSMKVGELEAHMATLWNKTDADVTHFDFVTNKNGALVSNAEFEPNTEFACLKSAKIKLSDDTYDKEEFKYHFKVIPPAMGAGLPFKEVYNSPIDADLVFYNAKKLDNFDINKIPTHQKSVLRRSIDKAKKLNSSYYSKDSYAALASALADGEKYYDQLDGKDAGTNQEISSAIAKKSEAIEAAIKGLQPGEAKTPDEVDPKTPDQKPDSKNVENTKQKTKNSNKKNSAKDKDAFPKTGDRMDLALYLGLALLSGSAILVVRTRKSKK